MAKTGVSWCTRLLLITISRVPRTEAGVADQLDMMTKAETYVLRFAKFMEDAYQQRCFSSASSRCENLNYDECNSLFPEQTCGGGKIYSRPECAVEGLSCNGLLDFSVSSVRLSQNVKKDANGNPTDNLVKEAVCYSRQAEEFMKDTFDNEKLYWQQFGVDPPQRHFGTDNGVFRIYPARQSVSEKCGTYDPTNRPWYVAATTGRKDVILVLDTSGSMDQNSRLTLMKVAAERVIDTLAVADHIGVVAFNTSASYVYGPEMMQATEDNKRRLIDKINNLSASGRTNFLDAFTKAFDMIDSAQRFKNFNYTSSCHTAILFLTDGQMTEPQGATAQNVTEYIKQRSDELEVHPHIFLYGLGSDAQDGPAADDLKQIACATGGMWSLVEDGGDLASAMASYYKLFALGLGDSGNEKFVAWVEPYEFFTGGILGTSVSAPVYNREVTPPVLVGAVAVDLPMSALEAAFRLGDVVDERTSKEATLEQLVQRSERICPLLNLTQCEIQSLRSAAGGEGALCDAQCMNFTNITYEQCSAETDYYPRNFWDNVENRGKSFAERTCCAIGETVNNGVVISSLKAQSTQCILGVENGGALPLTAIESSKKRAIVGGVVGGVMGLSLLCAMVAYNKEKLRKCFASPLILDSGVIPVPVPPPESPEYNQNRPTFHRQASAPPLEG